MEEPSDLIAVVQNVWPGVSDELAEELLWSTTCFPHGDIDKVKQQLVEYHEKSNGDPIVAMSIVLDEMAAALDEARHRTGWTCK